MTGPADRVLVPSLALGDTTSSSPEIRPPDAGATGLGAGRRRSRRAALALLFGTAALVAVERQTASADEAPATDEASAEAPPEVPASSDAPPADASGAAAPSDSPPPAEVSTAPLVAPPLTPRTYAVQAGDTLFSIARRHGVSVDALLWANNLTDANVLKQGQQLVIPPTTGRLHTVKDGDTLDSLAQSYSVSKAGIALVNGLAEDARLKAGQRLLIPVAVKPSGDPTFTPAPLMAANSSDPIPIPPPPPNAGTGSPTPPLISTIAPLILMPSVVTPPGAPVGAPVGAPTGVPTVTVTNRKIPKLAWPIPLNPPKSGISQGFFPGHTGIDIYSPQGTPIKVAADGTVKMAEKDPAGFSGYGWIVIVDHGDGISTWYAHCGGFSVKVGDTVKAGDTIGTVGMTGRTTGPHLHFELRVSATAIDPRLALA
jgi:murein DD-endopeptidase MepM/ murein hydrolase activator NlpD